MLDINPILLVATLIVFLTLIAVLNSSLYKPLFAYMSKRDEDIKKDLEKVGSNDDEINSLESKAQTIIVNAKLEASALREKVIADARELAESKLEAKRAELASQYLEYEQSLARAREQLASDLKSQIPLFKEAVKAKFSQI
ncbi:MAG: F0F1 ATP synthase subunit B' [Sulfurimonas sp. RIFCSPHIGHO2_12_FULL_36_9]|jgi:F-type H+-transporting ATPase subunit b|uniref:FoF1 ATP synthase subunit B' n=1 Tax=unclassified Sulfurimonas TaxID=2623549 RepID=UPI0008B6B144|nr:MULTISPECIES: FoF1 ATP synthase subunit B' [unclassified Sulfurimonas]OHD97668.1 MAG: F0F1 ATP synthase subunit B' [Sulfurimonas sp. RIFCSPHIGHO2_12_FULL_36_9]OHD98093.1 MAG: F0F1 ATP synthase subunit B' [Sulfurimonas sp. RIFCSPLOWO2_02_FULL_36_28]OHE01617.1 MAG: F0F1 ATP synthase subunit B' [Sulfurimonas sp. RIFCSPLOWO2_12_36_12]OHE03101.1 MAG: F0F1 ATP synthase subunit B' [Sulfurimonas sp. RIFCSPLOWO2_12_FULL_36_74]